MSKRLVILCDGTRNKAENVDRGKIKPTNVMKMVRAIQPVTHDGTVQITYYDEGVGNGPGLYGWLESIIGAGLDQRLLKAYRFLVYNYVPGDTIFFFGFSRGAYTVRSLAGFIQHVGLLPKDHDFYAPKAYELYRQRPPKDASQTAWQEQVAAFRAEHKVREMPIEFVGVWDTVGALGNPFNWWSFLTTRKHQFHDTSLCPGIRHAYHALALDEQRRNFAPTLWENPAAGQTLEQRWFAGVHSNIGGSYDNDGLANCTLHWMKSKAATLGLGVDEAFLRPYRAWFGDEWRDSMQWYYRFLGRHIRVVGASPTAHETIDESVRKRRQRPEANYHPKQDLDKLAHLFDELAP